MHDYGDEAQWDEIATEGVDWLHNRIHSASRIIIIHSNTNAVSVLEDDSDQEKGEKGRLLMVFDSSERVGIDAETAPIGDLDFIYGMNLLKCNLSNWHQQVYQRILNVR